MTDFQSVQIAIADVLLDIGAVGFTPDNPVTFRSGIIAPVYVDNRRLPFYPKIWKTIIDGFRTVIREKELSFEIIAGIEAGGIPHSAALGYATDRPSVFVRKEPKGHGKGKRVEGGDVRDRQILLIEDLITTGGSSLSGIQALRDEGADVDDCLAIVGYQFNVSQAAFDAAQVNLHLLAPFSLIAERAYERGVFDSEAREVIEAWHADPYSWTGESDDDNTTQ